MIDVSQTTQTSPFVLKRKAAWDGIRLEHCQFRAGELPKHRHSDHVVLITMSSGGKGELITSSGLGMRGTLTRGAVAVLPAGLEHQAVLEDPCEHLALCINPSLLERAAADTRLSGSFQIVERYTRADRIISSIGFALLDELNSEGLSGRLYAESLATVLAVHLLRNYSINGETPQKFHGGIAAGKLRQVTDFIADNYDRDVKLAELAQVAGMSNFHFAREFKRSTGTTPHQYLIKFRVEKAKRLLIQNELPLVEVGLQAGFNHQSHFTRLFRKVTGTTPQSYRLALRPNEKQLNVRLGPTTSKNSQNISKEMTDL